MKTIQFYLLVMLLLACGAQPTQSNEKTMILISSEAELENNVGKMVTLRGEVSNSKIPGILGVDVASDDPDLRGQMAEATGILVKTVVKAEEVDKYSANRGAGTFYRLKEPDSERTAQVQALPE